MEFRRSLSVDKEENNSIADSSNPTSSSTSDADTTNSGSRTNNTRIEEFSLERLAFDIDTVYGDDI